MFLYLLIFSYIVLHFDRVGKDLIVMYHSPQVQAYLNGISAKDLYSSKLIYQLGSLRKVRELVCHQVMC